MADKPTPKEIDDLVYELRQAGKDDTYSLASAVLAKWGTPAPVGVEPLIPFRHGCKWCGETTGCKHTTQPIQAQPVAREPLTHAQAKALVLKYGNDPLHLVYQVEVTHGIKGGQHGDDKP